MKKKKLLINIIVIVCLISTISIGNVAWGLYTRSYKEIAMKTIAILLILDYIIHLIMSIKKEKKILIKRLKITIIIFLLLWFGSYILCFGELSGNLELFKYIEW